MANKRTQRDFYNAMIAYFKGDATEVTVDEMVQFCEGRIAVLDNKSASRKPTKTQAENEVLKVKVLDVLGTEGITVTEVMSKDAELGALSNQKVSALLKALVTEGKVIKSEGEKRKSIFSLA